jgi:ribose transport system ATP-binding protein
MGEDRLVALMIGRPLTLAFPPRTENVAANEVLLSVAGLHGPRFGPIDLVLRKGEILGIAGAEGNGQHELLRCIAGLSRGGGSVRCNGAKVNLRSPYSALAAGIMLLSGDRMGESLFPVLGVRSNASAQVLRRFSKGGWLLRGKERTSVERIVARLKVRTPSIEQPVRFLSGGNQQKVLLARPFLRNVNVILAEEPTQGVDVKSRFDIYEALRAKAAEGVAMIVKSSDPLELAGLCDRVIVISRGQLIDEIEGSDLSEQRIVEGIVRSSARMRAPALPPAQAQATAGTHHG